MPTPPLNRRDWAVLPLLFLGLCLIYGSVLIYHYGFLDDYFWLDLSARDFHEVFARQAVGGRPINGLFLPLIFRLTGTINRLALVRLAVLAQLAVMAWMLYLAARRATSDRFASVHLAGLACTLPAIQVYAAWATSITIPLAGILAIAAAMAASSSRWSYRAAAVIFLFLSAITYQPAAMIFWPVAAIDLFAQLRRPFARRFVMYLSIAVIALALAWLIYRWGLAAYPNTRPSPQRDQLTAAPSKKIGWFLHYPLVDSLNLWNLRPTLWLAIPVAAFLIAGLLRHLNYRLGALAIIAVMLPLAYIPNLLVKENWSSYRTQIGLVWLILVFAWIALHALLPRRGFIIVLNLALDGAAFLAAYQMFTFFVYPQSMELAGYRDLVAKNQSATHTILLQPPPTSRFAPYSRYDEFGRSSLRAFWVPESETNLIRHELNPSLPPMIVDLYPDYVGPWPNPIPADTVLIDLR